MLYHDCSNVLFYFYFFLLSPCTAIHTLAEEKNEDQQRRNSCVLDLTGPSQIEKDLVHMSKNKEFPNDWNINYNYLKTKIVKTTNADIISIREKKRSVEDK